MAADDLNKPLGLSPARSPRLRRGWFVLAGGVAVVVLAGGLGWFVLQGTGNGPTATAEINAPGDGGGVALDRTGAILSPGGLTEVVPSGALTDLDEVVIHGLPDSPINLASAPDSAMVEDTIDGPLPRISADGTRPLEAYARPANVGARDVRIAIVIGGIGIDPQGTRNAIAKLPGQVTLAFAPYGDDLSADLAAARRDGHEILLQVPLEPFNYPTTNPGPNTLTADAGAEENISRLHWFMGRLTNYVGVVNYMGARFTGESGLLAPVMQEIGNRGLLYLDDGSSARSTAAQAAAGVAPFLRSDLVLDADLSGAAIDQRLRQLQAIANERGYAIATGTAFPETVERVAAFVKAASSRGIVIVPVSALAGNPS